ncbi:MAG TPA: serine hydrolase domain-containing protein, partial [Vicinamibacterales bacterium]
WILVSAAIEKASGERFLTFMRRQVFEPLGMKDTRADTLNEPIPHLATPYFPKFSADPRYGPDPMRPVDYSCYAGASVFVSTPSDLVRFAMAINSGKLLRPETVKRLQSPQRLASGQETGYALGWDLETVSIGGHDTRWVGHDGTLLGGPAAVLITFPDRGMAISLISNTSYAGVEPLAVSVAQAFAEDGRTPARQ